jgi:hypothetical protein
LQLTLECEEEKDDTLKPSSSFIVLLQHSFMKRTMMEHSRVPRHCLFSLLQLSREHKKEEEEGMLRIVVV